MNTSSFQSEVNRAACNLDNQMRSVCGIGRGDTTQTSISILPPLSQQEYELMNVLLSTQGRGGFTPEQDARLKSLIERYTFNGGKFPLPNPPAENNDTNSNAGSFATQSIDNVHDLLNFLKGAGVMLLGASLNPQTMPAVNIIVVASFLYAVRKQIQKFTFKLNIHGHR